MTTLLRLHDQAASTMMPPPTVPILSALTRASAADKRNSRTSRTTGQSTIGLGLEVEKHSIRNDYLNISQDEEQHKDLLRDPRLARPKLQAPESRRVEATLRRTEAAAEPGSSTTTFDDDDRESVTMNADDALDSSQRPNSRPLRPSFICRTLQRRRRTPRFGHPSHPQTSTFNSQACPRREAPAICDSELVPSLCLVVAQLRSANEPSRRTLEELEGPCDCLRRVEATTRAASGGVSTATEHLLKVGVGPVKSWRALSFPVSLSAPATLAGGSIRNITKLAPIIQATNPSVLDCRSLDEETLAFDQDLHPTFISWYQRDSPACACPAEPSCEPPICDVSSV
ncbi:hypothetical protein BKA70DRAFT_1464795 [Coprinopsis sp. MPI-PUGE-AT-0042]|nr:hypothetical protein BKA70DRAFT_1464795 [Coprinopsis sp. MPI-PUGE-AT-0042]